MKYKMVAAIVIDENGNETEVRADGFFTSIHSVEYGVEMSGFIASSLPGFAEDGAQILGAFHDPVANLPPEVSEARTKEMITALVNNDYHLAIVFKDPTPSFTERAQARAEALDLRKKAEEDFHRAEELIAGPKKD